MPGEPGWVRHAIWWHVYPLGFSGADTTGSDRSPVGGLGRLTGWLDYAVELGVSGIALGPIFESASHGYDTLDYFTVDSRLGGDGAFADLAAAARARGLRVLLDGVFNHIGRGHIGRGHIGRGHIGRGHIGGGHIGRGSVPLSRFARPDGAVFEGHRDLVALDHGRTEVQELVASVMEYWLDRGADGWRLDAAYAVDPGFWASVLPRVRARHPGAYFVGEVIHGDYAAMVESSGVDSVTQYELWKAVWSSLRDLNLFELGWALDRHNRWLDTFVPLTFVGNHDVTRIASQIGDPRHLVHALVVLMTVGGTPSVYYGDEQAYTGTKEERVGGDDAIRPPFPPSPAELAPFGWPTYRAHQDLIGLRRRHPWLHRARTEVVHLANRQLVYDAADPEGQGRLRVLLNLDDRELVHPAGLDGGRLLAGGASVGSAVTVPAHGWAVVG